jgi:uncharacterized protein YlxW (UPF0749 family)
MACTTSDAAAMARKVAEYEKKVVDFEKKVVNYERQVIDYERKVIEYNRSREEKITSLEKDIEDLNALIEGERTVHVEKEQLSVALKKLYDIIANHRGRYAENLVAKTLDVIKEVASVANFEK